MNTEMWKAIGDYSSKAWAAVGPLAGVLIGALLARAWDKKKWLNDKRADECRELLSQMTRVADSCLEVRALISLGDANIAAIQAAWTEDRKCMSIIQDRIFIAKKLGEAKMFRRWNEATSEFLKDGDLKQFGIKLNEMKGIIIDIAMRG